MENPPYYAPFSLIKQLTSSLREACHGLLASLVDLRLFTILFHFKNKQDLFR